MKLKSLLSFKPKLSKPNCSNMFSIFAKCPNKRCFSLKRPRFKRRRFRTKALKFKKPFSVKALRLPKCHPKLKRPRRKIRLRRKNPAPDTDRFGEKVSELVSVFRSTRRSKELDRVMDLKSIENNVAEKDQSNLSSPIAAEYAASAAAGKNESGEEVDESEGDVCRSFENYVSEMIVDEGKLKDLLDVEEMLYCWRNLKSPVFVDLVCRFYGELCSDLFSVEEEDGKITTPSPSTTTTTTSE